MSESVPTPTPQEPGRLAAGRLAARLRELRESQKLIRRQVAPRLGCSPSLLEKYERAERLPDRQVIIRYEEVFAAAGDLLGLWAEVEAERQAEQQRMAADRRKPTTPAHTPGRGRWRRPPPRTTPEPTPVLGSADGMRRSLDLLLDDGTPGCGLLERLSEQVESHAREALTLPPSTCSTGSCWPWATPGTSQRWGGPTRDGCEA